MRARIVFKANVTLAHLQGALDHLGWIPAEPQDSATVIKNRDHIREGLPEANNVRADAIAQHRLTVNRARTQTWGILCQEQTSSWAFRLDGSNTPEIHKASEDLLESLLIEYPQNYVAPEMAITLIGKAEVFERLGGVLPLHFGRFVRGRVARTWELRRWEIISLPALLLLAAACFLASYPWQLFEPTGPLTEAVRLQIAQNHWLKELWGRLGTAMAASLATALLYVLLTFTHTKRNWHVVWETAKAKS